MQIVRLKSPAPVKEPYYHGLAEELRKLSESPGKIYSTYCQMGARAGEKEVALVTTSKDIYLFLGAMSAAGQRRLCQVLEAEFQASTDGRVLLDGGQKGSAVLVTKFHQNDAGTVFHLSPAH